MAIQLWGSPEVLIASISKGKVKISDLIFLKITCEERMNFYFHYLTCNAKYCTRLQIYSEISVPIPTLNITLK